MDVKIKTSQLMFLITSFIMGSTLLITMVDGITGQSAWLVMIAASILSIPFLLMYISLAKRFPGRSLVEINDIVLGKVLGKLFSVIYLLYFFLIFTFNIADLSGFYVGYIVPEAPQMMFIIPVVLVSAFAVKRGISAIARVSVLTTIISIVFVILLALLLIGDMDFSNFLPLLDKPAIRYIQGTHAVMELPILEVVSMLMVVPMLHDQEKLTRRWLAGVGIAMALFTIITVRDTAVLGATANIMGDNSYEAIRIINIGEFLTRIELLIAIDYTTLLFVKISVLYYITATMISQLLRIHRDVVILPLGALGIFFSTIKVHSTVEHTIWGAQYAAVFSFLPTVGFPVILFLIAVIRKLRLAPPELQPPPEPPKKKSKQHARGKPAQNTN